MPRDCRHGQMAQSSSGSSSARANLFGCSSGSSGGEDHGRPIEPFERLAKDVGAGLLISVTHRCFGGFWHGSKVQASTCGSEAGPCSYAWKEKASVSTRRRCMGQEEKRPTSARKNKRGGIRKEKHKGNGG